MTAKDIQWSQPFPLFNAQHYLEVIKRPGVYRVRAFTEHGEPLSIPRLCGVDQLGILHIGKSNNLGTRIRMFRQAAGGLKASHHGGREFFEWRFDKLIPRERLRFDYFETATEEEALKLERSLHKEYRRNFLDRPPLDGTSGQSSE